MLNSPTVPQGFPPVPELTDETTLRLMTEMKGLVLQLFYMVNGFNADDTLATQSHGDGIVNTFKTNHEKLQNDLGTCISALRKTMDELYAFSGSHLPQVPGSIMLVSK